MFWSWVDKAKPIQPGGVLVVNEFSINWQQCLSSNQLLQNRKGEGSHSNAPASNKKGKWFEEILTWRVTRVFAKALSRSKVTKNLSSNDLKTTLPSLDHVNFLFSKITSMSFHSSMNLLNFLIHATSHSTCWKSLPFDLVILKSPPKHQASIQ